MKGKLLDIERYKIRKKIEAAGLDWVEDDEGKFRIWIRLKNELSKTNHFQERQ